MTKSFSVFIGLLLVTAAFTSCKNEPKVVAEDKPKAPDTIRVDPLPSAEGATTYNITEGQVQWQGRKSVKGQHNGTFTVKGGAIIVKEGRILGGKVQIDMNSLAVVDLTDAGQKGQLEGHLKSEDFFGTQRFPFAEFDIEEVMPSNTPDFDHVVAGKLKMKDKSHPVNIPVKLKIEGNEISVQSATFIINRTKWGINFGSGIIGTVKDKMIDDNVSVALTLKAKA